MPKESRRFATVLNERSFPNDVVLHDDERCKVIAVGTNFAADGAEVLTFFLRVIESGKMVEVKITAKSEGGAE